MLSVEAKRGKKKLMNGAPTTMGVPKAEGGTPEPCGLYNRKGLNQNDLSLPDVPRSGRCG
jgi:hypothetical protein